MFSRHLSDGFGIYQLGKANTSGKRFFTQLGDVLCAYSRPLEQRPCTILFNISAPWFEILHAKLRGQKVVLRVDSLYFDLLTESFLRQFIFPIGVMLRVVLACPFLRLFATDFANFLDSNFAGFFRICLADHVIYQSHFSSLVHQRYFERKPSSIIINGSCFVSQSFPPPRKKYDRVRLITIYDDWRPSKRIYDVLRFVEWLVNDCQMNIELTVLGYTGRIPASYPDDARVLLENRPYIKTLPRFSSFTADTAAALLAADCYVCFSFRDACPNAVIEAMAHGLPVLGVASGGIPEIVGDAGFLLPFDDFSAGFFSSHRFDYNFPAIDFPEMKDLLIKLLASQPELRARVRRRFDTVLGIESIAHRYAEVLRSVAREGRMTKNVPLVIR